MSVNMDMEQTEYSDHEVLHLETDITAFAADSDSNIGASDSEFVEYDVGDIIEGGLERDEVAELVYMRAEGHLFFQYDTAAPNVDDTPGTALGKHAVTLNGRTPSRATNDAVSGTIDLDDDGTNDGSFKAKTGDQMGELFNVELAAEQSWDDETNGVGGPGTQSNTVVLEVDYKDKFGRGPLLDHFDNYTIFDTLNRFSVSTQANMQFQHSFYYDIHIDEDRSPSF